MKTNPLATVCITFSLGIWTAKLVHIPLFFVYIACVLSLIAVLLSLERQLLFSLFLGLAIFLAGFLHFQNAQIHPANHIINFASDQGQRVYLIGKVVSNPEVSRTFYGSQKTVFTFRVKDLKAEENWQAVEGLVKVTLYGQRRLGYGEELLLQGSLERPAGLRNPGGFNYRAYLANYNIFGLLKVKEKDAFLFMGDSFGIGNRALPRTKRETVLNGLFRFKQRLSKIIYQHLEPEQAALLSAILLGERANLSQDIRDLFIKTGTIHILAISGLHVGLIAFILIALFRFFRLGRRTTFILTILLLISYAMLSGARPSVVRATIMAAIVLLGFLINRETKIYNSLGLAALVILIFNPNYLFDAGFQLSFLSVVSIVYFTPKIESLFPARKGFLFYLIKAFSVSLAAWIGIVPLAAYHFNIVSPIAVAANLVLVPCLFLVVSVGVCFLIFACLGPILGSIFAQTSWLTLFSLTTIASFFSRIPFGFFHTPQPGIFFFCSYYLLLLLIFNYKRLRLSLGKIGIILIFVGNFLVWKPLSKGTSDRLTVTFFDVGLGDAIFVEFPYSGQRLLIDGGPSKENDAGRWTILPFLWNKGINKIDALFLTHPDNDHVGGLASVLKNVKVDYVFDNGMPKKSVSYDAYKTQVAEQVPHYRILKRGEQILGFPQIKLYVLHPPRPFLAGREADTNNNSLVLKLVYKDVSFIFCADIQKKAIKHLISYSPILKSTVVKVPHHGSDEGRAEDDLFQAILPQLALISVDRNNRFGFPAAEVIERLERIGAEVYMTSEHGAVIISTDGQDVWVKPMVGAEAGI